MQPDTHDISNSQEWMISYSDLMSLLLCLFVMLYAISTVQETKFESATESLRGGFGLFHNVPSSSPMGAVTKSASQKIGGTIRFDLGSDDLSEGAKLELNEIHRQLLNVPRKIQIVGKAGLGEPSSYRREWDLAYSRAITAWDYLVLLGIDRERCEIVQQTGESAGALVEIRTVR